ncbi:hypothetical protein AB6V29_01435 [Microbacterium sp. 20-116]|uniref:hypothetical protein n=1 Tax=Microbacterium sp. 20-116 TaxID=3239883 RepID=UPI0034E1E16C
MIAVARLIREHRDAVVWTLRASCGVSISELGDGLTWGEAHSLLTRAAGDSATALGAELAGWAYPASMPELLTILISAGGEKALVKAAMGAMPWAMKTPRGSDATAEEVATAQAELEDSIVFAD